MYRAVLSLLGMLLFFGASEDVGDSPLDLIKLAREAHHAGKYQRAKQLFTEALAAKTDSADGEHQRTETTVEFAETLLELGEYARCEALCQQSMEALVKKHGENHLAIANAERILTRLCLHLRMSKLADQHCNRGLKICEAIRGATHPDAAPFHALMREIWNLRSGNGSSGGGERSLKILRNFDQSDQRLIVALEASAGDCYERWTPAHAARAVSIAEKVYGKRHPVYGRCLSTLATALRQTRDFEKSEVASKQAIEVLSAALDPNHPQLTAAYRNLASIERERGHTAQAEAALGDSIRLRFSTLSDTDLCHFFDQLYESDQYRAHSDDTSDMYLVEMTRRGGDIIQEFLSTKIDRLKERHAEIANQPEKELDTQQEENVKDFWRNRDQMAKYSRNLELVTALCRIQKKPDPLQISVEGTDELTCEFPAMPTLNVTIKNVDIARRDIGFQKWGDYRSGRQARWRILTRDATGKGETPKELTGPINGGGIFVETTLGPDEGWQTALVMSRFVETLEPGEYQTRVVYHDRLTIVDRDFVSGLILCESKVFKLTVKRRTIPISKNQVQEIRTLLEGLEDHKTCKIVAGEYGPWAHKFIAPESQDGRLLQLGWTAVPALIDDLGQENHKPERRAHLLALLYSITGIIDPRPDIFSQRSALGNYATLDEGWSVTSNKLGEKEPSQYSAGFTEGPSTHEGQIDAKAQAEVVARWMRFKQSIEVTVRD